MRWGVAAGAGLGVAGLGVAGLVALHLGSPPEPEPGPFFGIDVPQADVSTVSALADRLGCAPSVMNRFVKLDSDFDATDLAGLALAGRTPMVSLEPWLWSMNVGEGPAPAYSLARIARGDHDAALRSIARTLATHDDTVLLRFAHEMNADWYPWSIGTNGNSPAGYVSAWRHVHDVMAPIAPQARWVWAPVATWWPDPLPLRLVYPGDAYVDYVAVSGYGHAGTARDTYGDWYDEVRTLTSKPAILSEIGADGEDKVRWIDSLPAFLDDRPGIAGFVWFNTSPETTGATGDYRIDDSTEHLDAFRHALHAIGSTCTPSTIQEKTP
ncbi:exported hypothetical protein [metagenome]|uniref:GH26 domain-containing protein n=1 Tax=metagenome TaxID=256318 RepID=A0A2P2BZN3_9ZZZZ